MSSVAQCTNRKLGSVKTGFTGRKQSDWSVLNVGEVHPITFHVFLEGASPFPNVFYGLFARWICEINTTVVGNISSGRCVLHFNVKHPPKTSTKPTVNCRGSSLFQLF